MTGMKGHVRIERMRCLLFDIMVARGIEVIDDEADGGA